MINLKKVSRTFMLPSGDIDAVKNVNKNRKIVSVFEPHRFSRVLSLKKEFAKSFINSDIVLLCPMYAAGEKKC